MRAYATSITRQGDAKPFHEHTYRFPHHHWAILALQFVMVQASPGSYPRKDTRDGTLIELIYEGNEIRSIRYTEPRYIRLITRL